MFLSENGLFSNIKPYNLDVGLGANIHASIIIGLNLV
jgi:hypothetical protein